MTTHSQLWVPPHHSLPIWEGTPPGYQEEYGQPVPTLTPYLAPGSGATGSGGATGSSGATGSGGATGSSGATGSGGATNSGPHGAVIVLPGGGYEVKVMHEAEPVALWLNSLGISAFVLDYRVAPYRSPIPMLDARRAIQLVRSKAAEWSIDPQHVDILGFSAGGHLASTAGTHFEAVPGPEDAVARFSFRPDALILCYAVISFGEHRHQGSMENLLGPNPPANLREAFSNEKQVSAQTPPTFLWHTAADQSVPVENSLAFARALSACKIPFELHVFPSGEHGAGLAAGHECAEPWTNLCARWLENSGFKKKV